MKYSKEAIFDILFKYQKEAIAQGYNVYSIALKGSQNYGLDDDESDVDANIVFIPTLQQIRDNKPFKLTFPTGEVTGHNIYTFAEIVAKGNPQWVEVCHTEYKLGADLSEFQHYKLNPSALKGMVMEKVTAFSRLYPSSKKQIEQYGYSPKQLHHIIRLYDCLKHDTPIYKYSGEEADYMKAIKKGLLGLTAAETLRDKILYNLEQIYSDKKLAYEPQAVDYKLLDSIVMQHICKGTT